MRTILSALFLLSLYALHSQDLYPDFTYCSWDKIKLQENYQPQPGDTAMVFASTRFYDIKKDRFLSYDVDTAGSLHYFNIYFRQNNWICVPRKDLASAVHAAARRSPAVVFVEGFGKTFAGNTDRATRLTRQYNVLTIMFDWPTHNPDIGGKNYKVTIRTSKTIAKTFAKFLSDLDEYRRSSRDEIGNLSLIMHSMGNLLMMHAIQHNYITVKDTLFNSIILNAACVKQKKHYKWVEKINIQQHLYLTRNNHDKTLNGAKLISFHRQLGERARGPYAKNATYINFSKVLKLEHNYFLYAQVLKEHPDIKKIYADIFYGRPVMFDDPTRFVVKRNLVDMLPAKKQ